MVGLKGWWLMVHAPPGGWLQVELLRGLGWDLLMMFNTFISDLEDVMKCTLRESGDEARLVGSVNMLEDRAAIQRDPDQR